MFTEPVLHWRAKIGHSRISRELTNNYFAANYYNLLHDFDEYPPKHLYFKNDKIREFYHRNSQSRAQNSRIYCEFVTWRNCYFTWKVTNLLRILIQKFTNIWHWRKYFKTAFFVGISHPGAIGFCGITPVHAIGWGKWRYIEVGSIRLLLRGLRFLRGQWVISVPKFMV